MLPKQNSIHGQNFAGYEIFSFFAFSAKIVFLLPKVLSKWKLGRVVVNLFQKDVQLFTQKLLLFQLCIKMDDEPFNRVVSELKQG